MHQQQFSSTMSNSNLNFIFLNSDAELGKNRTKQTKIKHKNKYKQQTKHRTTAQNTYQHQMDQCAQQKRSVIN
jgi:hypothetical protein